MVVVIGGAAHEVLQGVHAAKTDIDLAGAEPFQSDSEPVGDLPPLREPVVRAGRLRAMITKSRMLHVPHQRMTFSVTVQAGCDEKFPPRGTALAAARTTQSFWDAA
jgi:hypothetical protein